jgi:dienelactone hydrolase
MTQHVSSYGLALLSTAIITLQQFSPCLAVNVPPPTGKYDVGMVSYAMPFDDEHNIAWPGNQSTSYLVTIYYPTLRTDDTQVTPYMDSEAAPKMDYVYNQIPGTVGNLTTNIKPNATIAQPSTGGLFPSIIFQPGFEGVTAMYTTMLTELVSRGYVVAGLDFPYEAPFVRYPNGTGATGVYIDGFTLDIIADVYAYRVRAGTNFIDSWPGLVKQLGAPFQTSPLGVLGQSLGGAAALGVAHAIPDVTVVGSAVNLDGGLYGDPASNMTSLADLKRPVLMMGETTSWNPLADPGWKDFQAAQSGWWRTLVVAGPDHQDFSDIVFWREFQPSGERGNGTIDASRMINITREFVTAFFNQSMLKQEEIVFDQPGTAWPEVTVYAEGNGTSYR